MSKAKAKRQKASFSTEWTEGQRVVIEDIEHKSKAFAPIQIDEGNLMGLNITWLIELKGTKNTKKAAHSIDQILKSIQYMQDQIKYPQVGKYVAKRDFVFAAIAGAPDKTLPALTNKDTNKLCKKLMAISGRRKEIKDMSMLFCYIRPNARYDKADVRGQKPPYEIVCYNKKEGYIPYPSMLMKLLEM